MRSQARALASELTEKLPAAALAGLISTLATVTPALAADYQAPPAPVAEAVKQQQVQSLEFQQPASLTAPDVRASASGEYQLPEGAQWRYSEFISAVENGKVERVRFSKDGTQLQLTAVDGRRAMVVLPNDPDLVDILARNGVDISVSEGDQQGNYVALLGNILFPLIAFGGLFFLFRRSQDGAGGGPMGPMGGPMDFGRSKSKFQEVPETGVTFADVAVSATQPGDVGIGAVRGQLMCSPSAVVAGHAIPCLTPVETCLLLNLRAAMAPSWSCRRWLTS